QAEVLRQRPETAGRRSGVALCRLLVSSRAGPLKNSMTTRLELAVPIEQMRRRAPSGSDLDSRGHLEGHELRLARPAAATFPDRRIGARPEPFAIRAHRRECLPAATTDRRRTLRQ